MALPVRSLKSRLAQPVNSRTGSRSSMVFGDCRDLVVQYRMIQLSSTEFKDVRKKVMQFM